MSDESGMFPTVEELEGAAYICLTMAATTDLSQFPPGSGNAQRRRFHKLKKRFEEAVTKTRAGASVREFGLSSQDFTWAAEQAEKAEDKEGWRCRFEMAAEEMKKEEETLDTADVSS